MTQTSRRRPLRPGEDQLSPSAATPGPAPSTPKPRRIARDLRTQREGVVMAAPSAHSRRYWLRPRGGGIEWEVPKEFVQLLNYENAA